MGLQTAAAHKRFNQSFLVNPEPFWGSEACHASLVKTLCVRSAFPWNVVLIALATSCHVDTCVGLFTRHSRINI